MSIAQQRRESAAKKANAYRNAATILGLIFLGNAASYPGMLRGCLIVLAIALFSLNYQLILKLLGSFAAADRLRRHKVSQGISLLGVSMGLSVFLFTLGFIL